jgi:hypothetical protein
VPSLRLNVPPKLLTIDCVTGMVRRYVAGLHLNSVQIIDWSAPSLHQELEMFRLRGPKKLEETK